MSRIRANWRTFRRTVAKTGTISREFRNNQNIAGSFNQPEWNDFKNNVQNYHDNRAIEVTNNIQNSFNNNFNSDWWKDSRRGLRRQIRELRRQIRELLRQIRELRRKVLVVGYSDVRHGRGVAGIRSLWKLR